MQAFWNERHPDDEIEVGSMDLAPDEVRGLIAEYYSDSRFRNRIFVDEREAMTI